MKATLDIPDDLYRSVKARSALEGRSLRAVAIELFQNWLRGPSNELAPDSPSPSPQDLSQFPWLAISSKYVKPGGHSGMEEIRESIARGWDADADEKFGPSSTKS